jgi:DNA-directed RNA polymerase specialized sigma24 family protein
MSAALEPHRPALLPDAVLMDRLGRRDSAALVELERRYRDSLYALVYGIMMDSIQADRVVHDIFVHLWRANDRYTLQRSVWDWLRQMAAELAHAERDRATRVVPAVRRIE